MKALFEMLELVEDIITASNTQGGGDDNTKEDCPRN